MTDQEPDCIFCKIASGSLGSEFLVENEHVVAFNDIAPVAPVHVLVVPRRHIESVQELHSTENGLWAEMLDTVQQVVAAEGVTKSGYRVVTNVGPDSGQEVPHLHLHVIAGRKLGHLG
jgi:histidine triad (HIT) family protein